MVDKVDTKATQFEQLNARTVEALTRSDNAEGVKRKHKTNVDAIVNDFERSLPDIDYNTDEELDNEHVANKDKTNVDANDFGRSLPDAEYNKDEEKEDDVEHNTAVSIHIPFANLFSIGNDKKVEEGPTRER
jgi:hypothetical protein